jgi:HAD superfamily hydrolase (TIGR01509 family)
MIGSRTVAAVVFDLDGVLLDSEQVWDDVRERLVRERGGRWRPEATRAMMGMSSPEWSRYLCEVLGVPGTPHDVSAEVVRRMQARYRERLPLIAGAGAAVERLAARWPLGLASSSNRPLIDAALVSSDMARHFRATVSSEEVGCGKPAPDVYLEAARRLAVEPAACVAIEDSTNGIRSAAAAAMGVIAIPNKQFEPAPLALALAAVVLDAIERLDADAVLAAAAAPRPVG